MHNRRALAPKQLHPQSLFQAAQLVAHRGLAQVQLLGGLGGAARLRDRLHQPQIARLQGAGSCS